MATGRLPTIAFVARKRRIRKRLGRVMRLSCRKDLFIWGTGSTLNASVKDGKTESHETLHLASDWSQPKLVERAERFCRDESESSNPTNVVAGAVRFV
jgi:hypothetical protein